YILLAPRVIVGDDAVAAAVKARVLTEGHVQVQRQAAFLIARQRSQSVAPKDIGREVGSELRGGGIRGVARTWSVITTHEIDVELRRLDHARGFGHGCSSVFGTHEYAFTSRSARSPE